VAATAIVLTGIASYRSLTPIEKLDLIKAHPGAYFFDDAPDLRLRPSEALTITSWYANSYGPITVFSLRDSRGVYWYGLFLLATAAVELAESDGYEVVGHYG
jgi:hypothetical protein